MFEVTENFSWRIREKRARERLTRESAAKKIGISRKTLSSIENEAGKKIKKNVYEKVVNWLIEN